MVSGTRCPAGSDPVKRWSESRAAAPKGRCPVEHRGEFRDVRPFVWPEGAYFRLYRADFPFEGIFEGWRAELKLGEQI